MYKDKKFLGIIPARGGSKGIKLKNIVDLAGKPLIAYSIECGLKSKYIDDVVVTTDSEKIAEVAREYGAQVPFLRPEELAQDTTTTAATVAHALKQLKELGKEYDDMVLLQPTQPLRTAEDVDGAIELYMEKGREPLISVSPVGEHPILMRSINSDGKLVNILETDKDTRRQDMPTFYKINGCIYINETKGFSETSTYSKFDIPYVMEQSHSVDIDEPMDLMVAEYYLKKGNE